TFKHCIFQARARRVGSEQEACDFARVVAKGSQRGAYNSVAPMAFRVMKDGQREEGFDDYGDSGTGERLLCLLKNWNAYDIVIVVIRIDKGFMGASFIGARKFKLVVDRAKLLLESCYLQARQ
ncbi:unnamed protein product, partial [Phaeothamnion confervicola]